MFSFMPPGFFLLAVLSALVAGVVKGLVGFAMPTIFISALGAFLSPELALAGLVLPTLVSNAMQALRQGGRAAVGSLIRFRRFLLIGAVALIASAQMFHSIPVWLLYLLIGVPITGFILLQILGWRPVLSADNRVMEVGVALFAGGLGGVSGIWGPPTVLYLTAIDTPKQEQVRLQGVAFGLGALALFGAHMQSGVLTLDRLWFSAVLVVPSVIGIWLGFQLQDRIDQKMFRRITFLVLLIAGLNLIRRGLVGLL